MTRIEFASSCSSISFRFSCRAFTRPVLFVSPGQHGHCFPDGIRIRPVSGCFRVVPYLFIALPMGFEPTIF